MKRFILAMILLFVLGVVHVPSEGRSRSEREVRNTGTVNSLDLEEIAVMME